MLAEEQLIIRQPGRGSFVADSNCASFKTYDNQNPVRTSRWLIGLVITNFSDMYGTELIYGMEEASRDNDCFLVVRRSFGIPELEEKAIQQLLGLGVDGLIIFPRRSQGYRSA